MPRRYTDIDSSNLIAYLAHRDRRFDDRGSIATYRELGPGSEHSWSRKHPPHGWKYLYSTTASVDAWIDRMATILDSEADQEQGMDDDEDDTAETRLQVETVITLLSAMFPGISREYFARAIDAKGGDLNLVFETLSDLFSVPKYEVGEAEGDEKDSTEEEEDSVSEAELPSRKRKRRMPAESDEEGEDNGEAFPGGHQAKSRGGSGSQRKRAKSTPSRPTASSSKPISRRVVSAPSKLESPPRGGSRTPAKPKSRTVYERAPAGWGADRGEMRRFAPMKLNVVLGEKGKGKEKAKRNRPSSPEA